MAFLVFKVFANCRMPLNFGFEYAIGHFFALIHLSCCQPNFVSVHLFDTNNDWVCVHLSSRFPRRLFGAKINYLSWLHTTNLSHPNHSMTEIILDSSLLLDEPEVNIATAHPWEDMATTPYAGRVHLLVKQVLNCAYGRERFSLSLPLPPSLYLSLFAFSFCIFILQNFLNPKTFCKYFLLLQVLPIS